VTRLCGRLRRPRQTSPQWQHMRSPPPRLRPSWCLAAWSSILHCGLGGRRYRPSMPVRRRIFSTSLFNARVIVIPPDDTSPTFPAMVSSSTRYQPCCYFFLLACWTSALIATYCHWVAEGEGDKLECSNIGYNRV